MLLIPCLFFHPCHPFHPPGQAVVGAELPDAQFSRDSADVASLMFDQSDEDQNSTGIKASSSTRLIGQVDFPIPIVCILLRRLNVQMLCPFEPSAECQNPSWFHNFVSLRR